MKKINYPRLVLVIGFALVLAFILRAAIFANYSVVGESMQPTLNDGNLLIVNKVIYDLQEAERFDVVVFHANEQDDYVKRVIGTPGDRIEYRNDKLYVNGEYVEEEFLESYKLASSSVPFTEDFTLEELTGETEVPDGKLFVLGDNRQDSLDSRSFGFIDQETVVGKVGMTYWPLPKASLTLGK
ncbi:signal peptidase I [Virgibacillus sp. YIM 98842]|jgi:signal peptidase I|uniref:signal peptidase I n=1 Tax=Virgibacillus sp. YIM 98842 TaxID=2663533 RepID=UPI0013D98242|nr:signal peptidase I [Virgibacillus sp. YIM 98842]